MTCSPCSNRQLSPSQVLSFVKNAPRLLNTELIDLSQEFPSTYVDDFIGDIEFVPYGHEPIYTDVIWKGDKAEQFTDWNGFQKIQSAQAPGSAFCAENDNCDYWDPDTLHGGTEQRQYGIYRRQVQTKEVCIDNLKWEYQFQTWFSNQITQAMNSRNSYIDQVIRESYIRHSRKVVVQHTATGLNFDAGNIYNLPFINDAAQVGILTFDYLMSYYDMLTHMVPASHTFGSMSGSPILELIIHPEDYRLMKLQEHIALNISPESVAQALGGRFSFTQQFEDLPFKIKFDKSCPRYDLGVDGGGAQIVAGQIDRDANRVFPIVRGVPNDVSTHSDYNPAYGNAQFRTAFLTVKMPFQLLTEEGIDNLDGAIDGAFTHTPNLLNNEWEWYSPQCDNPKAGRRGFYWAEMTIGERPLWRDSIMFFFRVPSREAFVQQIKLKECFDPEQTCGDDMPQTCPNPGIKDCCRGAADNQINFYFDFDAVTQYNLTVPGPVLVRTTNGVFAGNSVTATSDGQVVSVTFDPNTVDGAIECCKGGFIDFVAAVDTVCSSRLISAESVISGGNQAYKFVSEDVLACGTAADQVIAIFNDGSQESFTLLQDASGGGRTLYVSRDVTPDPDEGINCGAIERLCCVPSGSVNCPACDEAEPVCVPVPSV